MYKEKMETGHCYSRASGLGLHQPGKEELSG